MNRHTTGKHLLGIRDLHPVDIEMIIQRALHLAEQGEFLQSPPLQGTFVANLFFEPSTRTRFSFEVAERKLGMHPLNFSADSSSVTKGETLYDTLKTLEQMGVEVAVIRHKQDDVLRPLAERTNVRLVNAGDGANEHPTQFLLDVLTMKRHFGTIKGLKVAIIGDILHSRVARSHMWGLPKLGTSVILSGPPSMMLSPQKEGFREQAIRTLPIDEAVKQADVVMMLRVQLERHQSSLFPSAEEYHQNYGLTLERHATMQPGAVIMHPAPVNRGIEIADELVECANSLIYKQVENGVHVRMAVLERAKGGMDQWQSCLKTVNA